METIENKNILKRWERDPSLLVDSNFLNSPHKDNIGEQDSILLVHQSTFEVQETFLELLPCQSLRAKMVQLAEEDHPHLLVVGEHLPHHLLHLLHWNHLVLLLLRRAAAAAVFTAETAEAAAPKDGDACEKIIKARAPIFIGLAKWPDGVYVRGGNSSSSASSESSSSGLSSCE